MKVFTIGGAAAALDPSLIHQHSLQEADLLYTTSLSNQDNLILPSLTAAVKKNNAPIAVITDGARGVYVATRQSIYLHPSTSTNVVSTVRSWRCFLALLCRQPNKRTFHSGLIKKRYAQQRSSP